MPVALTIFGSSVEEQIRQVRHATSAGADWLILQPPMIGQFTAAMTKRYAAAMGGFPE